MMTLTVPSEIQHTQRISAEISPSTCRHCQCYKPEGQRGGHLRTQKGLASATNSQKSNASNELIANFLDGI